MTGYAIRNIGTPAVRKEVPELSQDKSKEALGELYEKEVWAVHIYCTTSMYGNKQCMYDKGNRIESNQRAKSVAFVYPNDAMACM